MIFATWTCAGVGLVATTLAVRLTTYWIGALNVIVPVHDEEMEGIAIAYRALGNLGGNFHAVFVFDCRWFSNHRVTLLLRDAFVKRYMQLKIGVHQTSDLTL